MIKFAIRICTVIGLFFAHTTVGSDLNSKNYSLIQGIVDGISGSITGDKTISCFQCEEYLQALDAHIKAVIDQDAQKIKEILDEQGTHVLSDAYYFSHGVHPTRFDAQAYKGVPIPICSNCLSLREKDTWDEKCSLHLTHLAEIAGYGSMTSTSHQGQQFGCVYGGITPIWEDIFSNLDETISKKPIVNFLELGSGYNLKPIALFFRGKGKINCTVNDINSEKIIDFIKKLYLLDPREITSEHKSAFIILDKGDFLTGRFRDAQKLDVVVITNVFHYFTEDQVGRAMEEISNILNPGGVAYIQAFSGTDEKNRANLFLEWMLSLQSIEQPIYLANGHKQIHDYIRELTNSNQPDSQTILKAAEKLPDIVHKSAKPFAFFPLKSLEALATRHNFSVEKSGLFNIKNVGGTTPYFSWVKIRK